MYVCNCYYSFSCMKLNLIKLSRASIYCIVDILSHLVAQKGVL